MSGIVARFVVASVPVALLAYTPFALAHHSWISGLSAPLVAWLLWRRHPRARFSTYVLLSLIVIRSALHGRAWLVAASLVAIAVMQLPAAVVAWPRLSSGTTPRRRRFRRR